MATYEYKGVKYCADCGNCDCVNASEKGSAYWLRCPAGYAEIARVTAHDPCVMNGCIHEYGHEGAHEYLNSDYA